MQISGGLQINRSNKPGPGLKANKTVPIVTDGLVVYLDAKSEASYSGTGTSWNDISGNNLHWTLAGSPTFNSVRGYFTFNGVDQWAQRNGGMHNPDNSDTTVSIWFRPLSTPVSNKPVWSDNYGPEWGVWIDQQNFVRSYVYGASTGTLVANGTWVNITMTHSVPGANSGLTYQHSTYVNGIISQRDRTGTVGNGLNDNPICIARDARADLIQYSNIDCSVWQMWNRRLSDSEVLQNFNALKYRFWQ